MKSRFSRGRVRHVPVNTESIAYALMYICIYYTGIYMIGFVIVCHRINEYLTFRSISVSRYEASREGWTAPIAFIFVSHLGNGYRIPNIKGILMTPKHVGAVLSQVWSNR